VFLVSCFCVTSLYRQLAQWELIIKHYIIRISRLPRKTNDAIPYDLQRAHLVFTPPEMDLSKRLILPWASHSSFVELSASTTTLQIHFRQAQPRREPLCQSTTQAGNLARHHTATAYVPYFPVEELAGPESSCR